MDRYRKCTCHLCDSRKSHITCSSTDEGDTTGNLPYTACRNMPRTLYAKEICICPGVGVLPGICLTCIPCSEAMSITCTSAGNSNRVQVMISKSTQCVPFKYGLGAVWYLDSICDPHIYVDMHGNRKSTKI